VFRFLQDTPLKLGLPAGLIIKLCTLFLHALSQVSGSLLFDAVSFPRPAVEFALLVKILETGMLAVEQVQVGVLVSGTLVVQLTGYRFTSAEDRYTYWPRLLTGE